MRIAITIVTLFALLAAAGLANSEADKEATLYTAYNIWRASKMKCINFKQGVDIIPAGTKVRDVKIKKQDPFPPYSCFYDGCRWPDLQNWFYPKMASEKIDQRLPANDVFDPKF
jgi:hypothetical protein